jgi:hypothetical protein
VALARSGHVRRCWGDVGDVMAQQGDEGEREEQWPEVGGPGASPPFFRVTRLGSGQGRLGVDSGVREGVAGYCYGSRAYE